MNDGFLKVAAGSPKLKVADCAYNADEIVKAAWRASVESVRLLVTPELGITGYTCGDLFGQQQLLDDAMAALMTICDETADLIDLMLVVGLPMKHRGKLFNCAAVLQNGQILGLVPKTHLPNYGEFYEQRQFSPAFPHIETIDLGFDEPVPFGTNLLFRCEEMPSFILAVEICEDLWAPSPPSISHALAGATVIANLSASDETVGKSAYRHSLVSGQSARLVCGYIYAGAGNGESTTDLVFAGQNLIAENGVMLAKTPLFSEDMAISELDLDRLARERQVLSTFPVADIHAYYTLVFSMELTQTTLTRKISKAPYIPDTTPELAERCETILSIQAAGLCKRMEHTGARTAVLGVSGGLDSTLALLASVHAFNRLGYPLTDILAVMMPGFGTTERTADNADRLCDALGVQKLRIDITATVREHFHSIQHEEENHNVVYENAQARVRTLILMDLANQHNGLVVGTGDLSELALGWATYNGDHMSMYSVNASVPKTLIRHIIAHEAKKSLPLKEILQNILDTPVSPELLPAVDGEISQKTEQIVGPYALHDFFLYYFMRWGCPPHKILRLAAVAFADEHDEKEILRWLKVFYRRFFSQQYKRSCLPDGPKVGSVSLSPRGDWRMPSDACVDGWMRDLEEMESWRR